MSTAQIHKRHVTDTLKLLSFTLQSENLAGTMTALDLTNAVSGDVKFKMINAADGTTTIALTATGVTFNADTTGTGDYDFSAAGVLTAGIYHGFVVFTDTAETDHYPYKPGDLVIEIHSDTQSAQAAYEAAKQAL